MKKCREYEGTKTQKREQRSGSILSRQPLLTALMAGVSRLCVHPPPSVQGVCVLKSFSVHFCDDNMSSPFSAFFPAICIIESTYS